MKFQNNIAEAEWALTKKPMLATTVERVMILDELKSAYRELPQPLRFSAFLRELLSRVSLPLEAYDLIAGRSVDRELTPDEEAVFQAFLKSPDFPARTVWFGSGHCTYSWESLVSKGLVGLRAEVMARLSVCTGEDERVFLRAVIEVYDAISAYMLRYADAAEEKGLFPLAARLRAAATEVPQHFDVALQLLWIVTFINCAYITPNPTLTVGRLDLILLPLYRKDIATGVLTRERAAALITDYYCKHNLIMGRGEHQVGDATNSTTFERICCFDAPQYLLLAGRDKNGEVIANELTELFAACIVPSFKNPVVVVRYVKGMDKTHPALWRTLTEKAYDSASMMFYNDDNVSATMRRIGFSSAESYGYEHFGCNWCSPGVDSAWMNATPRSAKYGVYRDADEAARFAVPYANIRTASPHGWPEDLLKVLEEVAERGEKNATIEDVYDGFFARMSDFIDRKLAYLSAELAVRRRRPAALLTFGDCFLDSSLENAACFSAGAKYHFELQAFQMFGTVADCFIAVDQLVMREKKLTLRELLDATRANFVGYERVLSLCRHADKYGMDTKLSAQHVTRLSRQATDMVIEKSRPYLEREGLLLTPCMQSDTWHLKMGEDFGATPDGRLAHTPFSQNTRPSNGACVNGMTAMLNDMLHLPKDGLLSGALNLDIDKKQFVGEEGRAIFAALLGSYLNRGGLHAQVTAVDAAALADAKKNPHDHRDLRVRVTGYSGVFVDMPERLQNDMIERLK